MSRPGKIQYINGFYTGNNYLNDEQMDVNAVWIIYFLTGYKPDEWRSMKAICAMLGNMVQESTINPGLWQNFNENNVNTGFSLVQWTPASKYLNWCKEQSLTPQYMDSALLRLDWERENEGGASDQWIPVSQFDNLTFNQFSRGLTSLSVRELTECFMRSYERPSEQYANLANRVKWARYYYERFGDDIPEPSEPPVIPTPPGQYHPDGWPWWLYLRKRRRV